MSSGGIILVRRAQPSDFPYILKIEELCFSDHPWDLEALARYECTVALVSESVAGFLISRTLTPDGMHLAEHEILNLAVHPDHRRRGVATALLNHALARGGEHFLEVRESNSTARKLYTSLHFMEIGRRESYYSNPRESAIVMKRKW
jgi:ribosomal-protein-alanine N-acetyltransferase